MLGNGKYSAWFRTPLGEGTGVVVLKDGKITGGDTVIAYTGSCNQVGDEFTADISTKRHTPGNCRYSESTRSILSLRENPPVQWRRVGEHHIKPQA
jgi:hypothetical protein